MLIRVRDLEFESVAAVAAHFGVTVFHVSAALRNGRGDHIGLGRAHKGQSMPRKAERMPVIVRGKRFESATACAKHFGIAECTVYGMISCGRADFIGLGSDRSRRARAGRSKPITIGPLSFPSRRAASLALGFSDSYVVNALRGKTGYSMQKVVAAAMALEARQNAMRARKAA